MCTSIYGYRFRYGFHNLGGPFGGPTNPKAEHSLKTSLGPKSLK